MSRLNEFEALKNEIKEVPTSANFSATRALAKRKRQTAIRGTIGSLATFFCTFVIMVNLFPTVAYAMGRIPPLRELAKAVALSPALEAAVENQYVQPVEISKTQGDITVDIEYIIVDQKQINIFYTLDSKEYDSLVADPDLFDNENNRLQAIVSGSGYNKENGELRSIEVDFIDENVPSSINTELSVYSNGTSNEPVEVDSSYEDDMFNTDDWGEPDYIETFSFELNFDPYFTAQGEKVEINQDFYLGDEKFTVTEIETYPTHMRLNIAEHVENSKHLQAIKFYIDNEDGDVIDPISDGIISTGTGEDNVTSYRLESDFFDKSEELTLFITEATWLDKDRERMRIDLENETADDLPDGVSLADVDHRSDGYILTFNAVEFEEFHSYQLFGHLFYDIEGNEYHINTWSSSHVDDGFFEESFPLVDFHGDEVWLSPHFTHREQFSEVSIKLK